MCFLISPIKADGRTGSRPGALPLLEIGGIDEMTDYKKMYFQLAAKVADVMDILLKAQREGEKEYMEGEPFPEGKVMVIQDEGCECE